MDQRRLEQMDLDAKAQLTRLQSLLTLPRETIPRLTPQVVRSVLRGAGDRLGLEFIEIEGVTPIFLLLPQDEGGTQTTLFQTWHSESLPTSPGSVEGAERLALGAALAAMEAVMGLGGRGEGASPRLALVVAPAATSGSQTLDAALREHRGRIEAGAVAWIRIAAKAPRRRRVFLGARGRMVVGIRGGDGNPYRARDQVVAELAEEAYGPRPLDFELIRKISEQPESNEFLREAAGPISGEGEEWIRSALFQPRGDVVVPPGAHPERPRAWISLEIAEAMEPETIVGRLAELTGGQADLVERFPWDRSNIHHPVTQAIIALAKSRSEGPEIWPSSPWPTPSGLFTRALGIGVAEWAIPLPPGSAFRIPKTEEFEAIASEAAELLLQTLG